MAKIFGLDLEAHGLGIRLELETLARAFIQKFSPGGVNLTHGSHTGEARRAESEGYRVLGEGACSKPPPYQLGGLGERGLGQSPPKIWIFCISGTHKMPNDAFSMYTV